MESKSLLIGIVSFMAGALLVSTAATTFDKPSSSDSMTAMVETLKSKTGDEFDEAFVAEMIAHHEGAIEMARLSENQAKHDEIKSLSKAIISAQEKEISDMRHWQGMWGYDTDNSSSDAH
jgi:uncharacterized protein (DUF305 family)